MIVIRERFKRAFSLLVWSSLFLALASVRVHAINQDGSVHEMVENIGASSEVLLAILAQPTFMVALIILLIYLLIYQVIKLALMRAMASGMFGGSSGRFGRSGIGGDDSSGAFRGLNHALTGIITISILFGGSFRDGSLSTENIQTNIHGLLSTVSMLPLIFTVLIAGLYLITSLNNNPDMPKGRRFGNILMIFGVATWASQGLMGSFWSASGIVLFAVGLFVSLFHASFRSPSLGRSSSPGSPSSPGRSGDGVFSKIGGAIADRIRSGGASKSERRAEKAAKKQKKKMKAVPEIRSLHKPEMFRTKAMELADYLKKLRGDFEKEHNTLSSMEGKVNELHGLVDPIDPHMESAPLRGIIEKMKSTAKELEDMSKAEEEAHKHETRLFRRTYRRDIRRPEKTIEADYEKMSKNLAKFKKTWDSSSLENYDKIVSEMEELVNSQYNMMRNMKMARSVITEAESKLKNIITFKGKAVEFKKAVDDLEKKIDRFEKDWNRSTDTNDKEKINQEKVDGVARSKEEIVKVVSMFTDGINKDEGTLASIAKTLNNIDGMSKLLIQLANNYANVYSHSLDVHDQLEQRVTELDHTYDGVTEIIHRASEGIKAIEKTYKDAENSFFRSDNEFSTNSDRILGMQKQNIDGYQELNAMVANNANDQSLREIVAEASNSLQSINSEFEKMQHNMGILKQIRESIQDDIVRYNQMMGTQGLEDYQTIQIMGSLLEDMYNKIHQAPDLQDDDFKNSLLRSIGREIDGLKNQQNSSSSSQEAS